MLFFEDNYFLLKENGINLKINPVLWVNFLFLKVSALFVPWSYSLSMYRQLRLLVMALYL